MSKFDNSTSALEEAAASCWRWVSTVRGSTSGHVGERWRLHVGGVSLPLDEGTGSLLLEDPPVACWREAAASCRRCVSTVRRGIDCALERSRGGIDCAFAKARLDQDFRSILKEASIVGVWMLYGVL